MRTVTRRAITRRTACSVGWVLVGALMAGCSADGSTPAGTKRSSTKQGRSAQHLSTTVSSAAHDLRVVVTGAVSGQRLREVLGDAQTAAARVRRVWGDAVLRTTVRIEVASDDADFRRRGGSAERGAQIAATATADGRVVLAPSLFVDVTAPGRTVVLTHELTHIALHQTRSTDVARWVVEGAAELTAYRPTGLGLPRLAPQLVSAVRAGKVPAAPPDDARFDAAPQAAYQEAYAWCAFLVDRFGLHRFTGFVRSSGAGGKDDFVAAFGVSAASLRPPFETFLKAQSDGAHSTSHPAG